MSEQFEKCLRALLEECKGGLITKTDNEFKFSLPGEPEPNGEPFLGIYPSATPEVDWRVMFHGGPEAERYYREFTANPDNYTLGRAA